MSNGPYSVMISVILHPFKPYEVLKDVAYPRIQSTCKLGDIHLFVYKSHSVLKTLFELLPSMTLAFM